jgi:hypothetical protein
MARCLRCIISVRRVWAELNLDVGRYRGRTEAGRAVECRRLIAFAPSLAAGLDLHRIRAAPFKWPV